MLQGHVSAESQQVGWPGRFIHVRHCGGLSLFFLQLKDPLDKDFSVFIKSGHVLYCFFQCCLFPFESIQENGIIKLLEKLAIL